MRKSKVMLRSIKNKDIDLIVREMMEFCNWRDLVKPDSRVFIKPNLCTDDVLRIEAANTSPDLIESVCKVLLEKTKNITICESNATRGSADDAFINTGLGKLIEKYSVRWCNLSNCEEIFIGHRIFDKYKTGLPRDLLEADLVIDLPTLKTHALTVFTGAVKNLWGCVPRYDRIWLHKHLDELISDLIGICKPRISIMDAIVCAEGRGPTNGIPRRLDLLLASNDPVALDATSMRLVGIDPQTARHLVLSQKKGFGNLAAEDIEIDGDFEKEKVQFIPAILDVAVWSMNYFSRYRFFVKYILMNQTIFKYTRKFVMFLRKIRVLSDVRPKASL
jgi:uncharacterized protein (DUF362 family)